MDRLSDNLKTRYYKGLQEYLKCENSDGLSHAYEMGRKAAREGVSELDLISYHHNKLIEIDNSNFELEYEKKIKRASNYLRECLAPFEVKLGSYREVIDELQEKNKKLNEEIKNRRKVEKELFRSKEYFQSLIENARDIITVLDTKGIIRYSSPSIERILGYTQRELLGRNAFQYVHEMDLKRVRKLFEELTSTSMETASIEFRFQHKEGDWIYLECIAAYIENNPDDPKVIVNSRNVTERKRATQKLREHKFQLSEAQKIAKVGSWQWEIGDEEGVQWSDEMCRIFGLEPGKFDNEYSTFIEFIHPEDKERFKNTVEKALKAKDSFSIEHRIIRRDGDERILLCRGHVVFNRAGEVVKMVGTGQDITEQKEKERQLKDYSERLRNLSEKIERAREEERIRIARQVHDELGQMLTVLKIDVSVMKEEFQKELSDEIIEPHVKEILDRINVIIKSVRRITTELRPEVLDDLGLKEAIEWQGNEFEDRTGIEVAFSSNIDKTNFLDDKQATTLFRILQETLTNIIRHAEATKVDIELRKESDNLHLIVEDNGVGITNDQKVASSSLGIIGMRERTQFLGGDVNIDGEPDEGTTVTLSIPINGKQ